jgi:glutamyl-Q tRNA(Asp) synthetase
VLNNSSDTSVLTLPERTRFAPSPTGFLHLGHAFAAIKAHDSADRNEFLVRIEDLDIGRARSEFTTAIYEDLRWLGLTWREPVLQQSSRSDAYRAALDKLERRSLVYPCFCTRRQIAEEIARSVEAPHSVKAGATYPGTCRLLTVAEREHRIAAGDSYALRLDATKAVNLCPALQFDEHGGGPNGEFGRLIVDPLLFGDMVLARKDSPAAYHLAVVVDDAFQDVTLVTRGDDLFSSTHIQRVLQHLLELPVPRYAHHRLILDEQGRKFSKRDHAVTLRSLRGMGVTPAQIRQRLGLPLSV